MDVEPQHVELKTEHRMACIHKETIDAFFNKKPSIPYTQCSQKSSDPTGASLMSVFAGAKVKMSI